MKAEKKKSYRRSKVYNIAREDRNCTIYWNIEKLENYYKERFQELDEIKERSESKRKFPYWLFGE